MPIRFVCNAELLENLKYVWLPFRSIFVFGEVYLARIRSRLQCSTTLNWIYDPSVNELVNNRGKLEMRLKDIITTPVLAFGRGLDSGCEGVNNFVNLDFASSFSSVLTVEHFPQALAQHVLYCPRLGLVDQSSSEKRACKIPYGKWSYANKRYSLLDLLIPPASTQLVMQVRFDS